MKPLPPHRLQERINEDSEANTSWDLVDIAKSVRKDIQAAVERGSLPKLTARVRIDRGGVNTHPSLNILVTDIDIGAKVRSSKVVTLIEAPRRFRRSNGVPIKMKAIRVLNLLHEIGERYQMRPPLPHESLRLRSRPKPLSLR